MHTKRIKNRVVATTIATTIACSNVGMIVNADTIELKNNNSSKVVRDNAVDEAPVIHTEDVYVALGSEFDLMDGVTATNNAGDNITSDVEIEGVVDTALDTSREYRKTVTYSVKDSSNNKITYKNRNVYVIKPSVVNDPLAVIDKKGILTIEDNGVTESFATDKFSNKGWGKAYYDVSREDAITYTESVKQGDTVIASELLSDVVESSTTKYLIEAEEAGTLNIGVSVDGVANGKVGKVKVNGEEVYNSSTLEDVTNAYDTYLDVAVELEAGNNEVEFEFSKAPSVDSEGDLGGDSSEDVEEPSEEPSTFASDTDRMYIHSMTLGALNLLDGEVESDKLQYKVNDGDWLDYTSPVDLKKLATEENPTVKVDVQSVYTSSLGVVESSTDNTGDSSIDVPVLVKPIISANDVVINVGDTFKELEGVTAVDGNGDDISSSVQVVTSNVNTSEAGVYNVTYRVTTEMGATATKTITVTVKRAEGIIGNAPVITLPKNNVELTVGDTFDAMAGVTATDVEDKDITKGIKITENTVNPNKEGNYVVVYEVTDKDGNKVTKTLNVVVKAKDKGEVPVINAKDMEVRLNDEFIELHGVTATDKEDGNLTDKVKVLSTNVNTNKEGVYTVVFGVEDKDGNSVTKTIKVTVKADATNKGEAPVIYANDKTIMQGGVYNALEDVTASDKEDGNLTSKLQIEASNVDVNTPGDYIVTFSVVDKDGNKSTKSITVTVVANNNGNDNTNNGNTNNGTTNGGTTDNNNSTNNGDVNAAQKPVINAVDIVIPLGMNMAYVLEGVTATDKIDGNITDKIQIKNTNIDFNKEGKYTITFKVTNSKGVSEEKTINVEVNKNAKATNSAGVTNGTNNPNGSETKPENVKTFDNMTVYLGAFLTSLISSVGILFKMRKR